MLARLSPVIGLVWFLATVSCCESGDSAPLIVPFTAADVIRRQVPLEGRLYCVEGFIRELWRPPLVEGSCIAIEMPNAFSDRLQHGGASRVYVSARAHESGIGVTLEGSPDIIGPLSLGPPWAVGNREHFIRMTGQLGLVPFGDGGRAFMMKPLLVEVLRTFERGAEADGEAAVQARSERAARQAMEGLPLSQSEYTRLATEARALSDTVLRLHCLRCLLFSSLTCLQRGVSASVLEGLVREAPLPPDIQMSRPLLEYIGKVLGQNPSEDTSNLWRLYLGERLANR